MDHPWGDHAAEDVEAEYGMPARVKVQGNSKGTTVFVALPTMPSAEPAEVKAKVTEIVKRHINDADRVVVNVNL